MDDDSEQTQAVELLQQLGLKQYEARCFVALSRLPHGTAKEVSEISDVPRTRVYDAIAELEAKGLVEVQHSNPQQFRAVSIEEATATLRATFASRTESLERALRSIEPASSDSEAGVTHDVWSLSGQTAIASRTEQLIDEADQEVLLVVGDDTVFTAALEERLRDATARGVDLVVGTVDDALRETVQAALPEADVFVSGLEWLRQSNLPGDTTEIGRLLLLDRETILVSTFTRSATDEREHEQAVFGRGFDNGIVTIVRRLIATGLLPTDAFGDGDS
jgi:sugar-specific transcriptional regulator TrmB